MSGWREWRFTHRLVSRAYTLGIISASGLQGTSRGWRLLFVHWTGKRPYILGLQRERWGFPVHWLRYHHWPEPVIWGLCGKCAPWPCCGATGYDHAPDCKDEW